MDKKVFLLKRKYQYTQRTQEWYDVRRTLITASSASSLLQKNKKTCESYVNTYGLHDIFDYNDKSCNPYSSKKQFFLDKCNQSSFKGNIATYWGQTYEPVVTDIYSKLTGKEVLEFGLIVHSEHSWLGASPDGITPDGIMIEIKCPFRRKITGIPPLYYWIQVQLQLEVCDLEYCDFVEYEFVEFMTEEEFLDDNTLDIDIINKGVYIKVERKMQTGIPCGPENIDYVYPEKQFIDDTDNLIKWKNYQLENLPKTVNDKSKDYNLEYKAVYWKVCDKSIVRIKRDKEWFNSVKKDLENEWKQLLYYKKNDNYKKLLTNEKTYHQGETLVLEGFKSEEEADKYLFSDTDNEE